MHHALEIQEILLNIFAHFYPEFDVRTASYDDSAFDLIALARTCRAFKDPAVNILWEDLDSLAPLVRCIPEACYQASESFDYSFRRPLTQIEWNILQSYTRRIRSITLWDTDFGICQKSLITLAQASTHELLLFPNVRDLHLEYRHKNKALLLHPFPSLVSLGVKLWDKRYFQSSLKLLAKTSPCLARLDIGRSYCGPYMDMNHLDSRCLCLWRNLRTIDCIQIPPDETTLMCLSRIPTLTNLKFMVRSTLPDQISPSVPPIVFPYLKDLELRSNHLYPTPRLLCRFRLPVITKLDGCNEYRPFRQDLSSFFASVQKASSGVQILWLSDRRLQDPRSEDLMLGFRDLQPCMEFCHLRQIMFDIGWSVELTDRELLKLSSAWPRLESLVINPYWGWNTLGGITPHGLLQLLQTCPSLTGVALAIDTRGYTEITPSPASIGLSLPRAFWIDALDSFIAAESVPAIAAFFAALGSTSTSEYWLTAWHTSTKCQNRETREVCKPRWDDVRRQADNLRSTIGWGT